MRSTLPNGFARAVHDFFGPYLLEQRGLSRHTVLSYRDTLALLLRFIAQTRRTDPTALDLDAISPDIVLAFLNHLESERHNKTSSRNVRLAAIHAFFRYVSIHFPERHVYSRFSRSWVSRLSAPQPNPSTTSSTRRSARYWAV